MGDFAELKGKTVALLGYDNIAIEQAKKLRELGIKVIIGVREGWNEEAAKQDGFQVFNLHEAVAQADIIQVW
ncbi:hypothetical protein skT53_33900 [Effusibacillus dendaii]|uniref:KARI N-terminal Rossmann domain-containing protein n=2 Tax=Effusibacillus dendaii TaxID=2743772 RepID=A0A7I8DEC9_9BACL|nr:hypothetical protein skT53_33900 [Effusibacillus dendaii]